MAKSKQQPKTIRPEQVESAPTRSTNGASRDTRIKFKFSSEFRREFSKYAELQNLKLNPFLFEASAALKVAHV